MANSLTNEELEAKIEERTQELLEENQLLKMQLEERIMMTDVLHENEQQFRALVSNIPGAVYRFSIEAEWIIEFISDVIEEITAYPSSHFKWKEIQTYRSLIHSEDQEDVKQGILKGMEPLESFSVEYRLYDANNEIHWVVEKGQAVYSAEGNPLWLDGTIFDITDRKKAEEALAATQKELIESAHQAGMADIATDTLHNVGNILNSVKTSSQIINDVIKSSSLSGLKKAGSMLRDNMDDIESFITNDPKAEKLLQYYLKLEDEFTKEHDTVLDHVERLDEKVKSIEDVIKAQQSYAGTSALTELLDLSEIIEDAIIMQSGEFEQSSIRVEKKFQDVQKVNVQKNKFIHVIVNLIQNARDALSTTHEKKRALTFAIHDNDDAIFVNIMDTGSGIDRENLEKIFSHGFSTKKDGQGYGLHSSANYMNEMGGRMWAESDGIEKGATLILRFPHP